MSAPTGEAYLKEGVELRLRVLIDRLVAGYALLVMIPAAQPALRTLTHSSWWWLLLFAAGLTVSVLGMAVWALRGRGLAPWGYGYLGCLVGGVVTAPLAVPATTSQSPLWWHVGSAIACAGALLGFRPAALYACVLGLAYGLVRPTPAFGAAAGHVAIGEAVFGVVAPLCIVAIQIALRRSAAAADTLAATLRRREVQETVEVTVARERDRLNRMIHDDVMTVLTAVAHAEDRPTVAATAALAAETLTQLEVPAGRGGGSMDMEAFATMAADMVRRVSPSIRFEDLTDPALARCPLPVTTAEAFLSATREAVRNAVRHAEADVIEARCRLQDLENGRVRLEVVVSDDGRGFSTVAVAPERLGLGLSIDRALAAVGARAEVRTAPGGGTTVRMSQLLRRRGALLSTEATERVDPEALPADFPADLLIRVVWLTVLTLILSGLLNVGVVDPLWPYVAAMGLMVVLTSVVLARGSLLLTARATVVAVLLLFGVAAGVNVALPTVGSADGAQWHLFPLQLVLVVLVVRNRLAAAGVALVLVVGCSAAWALQTRDPDHTLLAAAFGPIAFLVMAGLFRNALRAIARRQTSLLTQETAAIHDTVQRYVGQVQRSLWLDDLRKVTRGPLLRIAALTDHVPEELRRESLLLEASLRETIAARDVMTEELAGLTEAARRRGVRVEFVDSRQQPLPEVVNRAVAGELRRHLASQTVSRVVVRIGPDGQPALVSVVSVDEGDLQQTTIDARGDRLGEARARG